MEKLRRLTPDERKGVIKDGRKNFIDLFGIDETQYHHIAQDMIDHFTITVGDIEDQMIKLYPEYYE